jgi:hypothetical protein
METIISTLIFAVVWVAMQIWEIVSNKWVWAICVVYYFFIQPVVKHFEEQDSRLVRVERMLKSLGGKNWNEDA